MEITESVVLQANYLLELMVDEQDVDGSQGVVVLCMSHQSLSEITKMEDNNQRNGPLVLSCSWFLGSHDDDTDAAASSACI